MKTLEQIFKRSLTKEAMNLIFVKSETPKSDFVVENGFGIKVKSLALPSNNLGVEKTEAEVLDWLQNKIHSQYSAYYQMQFKYKEDTEQVSWNNNKVQNQRYLETSEN